MYLVPSSSSSFLTHDQEINDQDEEISSPESQSSFTNDSLDESSDFGVDEYMSSAPGSCLISPNDLNHNPPHLCSRVLEGRESQRLSPASGYSVFGGKSAPPNLPTSLSSEFDRPAYGLPKIIITEPELQNLSHSAISSNQSMFEQHEWEEPYRMESTPSYNTSAAWAGTGDGRMHSQGYRAIPPFSFQMYMGTPQDMDTYTQ